eukprot:gb/GFBE01056158.1/.p1 GENE.gb/GFBE01056158.1/~~gb/GFBE01056158.1/.p1  ORF type:complete len:103 (+),score=16.98 gb/GFBE01056158.1/:1-309(+)
MTAAPSCERPACVGEETAAQPRKRCRTEPATAPCAQSKKCRACGQLCSCRRFRVKRAPHIGLRLSVGTTYSEADLRQRCNGNIEKLWNLDLKMQCPDVLEEV